MPWSCEGQQWKHQVKSANQYHGCRRGYRHVLGRAYRHDLFDAAGWRCPRRSTGTLSGYLTDVGIDDKWMKETAAAIQPGTAALFVLVRKVTGDKVLERLKGEGGTVLKTSLDHTKEAALQAALAEVKAAVQGSPPV
jgi:hypothetical protein